MYTVHLQNGGHPKDRFLKDTLKQVKGITFGINPWRHFHADPYKQYFMELCVLSKNVVAMLHTVMAATAHNNRGIDHEGRGGEVW